MDSEDLMVEASVAGEDTGGNANYVCIGDGSLWEEKMGEKVAGVEKHESLDGATDPNAAKALRPSAHAPGPLFRTSLCKRHPSWARATCSWTQARNARIRA